MSISKSVADESDNTCFVGVMLTAAVFFASLSGCEMQLAPDQGELSSSVTAVEAAGPEVVELRAVGTQFVGPSKIPSGWTTFRFINSSPMIHFAIIDVPPAGVNAQEVSESVMMPFQEAMDAMNAGDDDAVNAAYGRFPEWLSELGRNGGPGLLSAGLTGQTTVYLAPGHYVIECYVKTDGVFHSTPPAEGRLGMLLDLTVTGEDNGAPEPAPTVTLDLSNDGIELESGAWKQGLNTVRVNVIEQQALPNFAGNDVHLLRVDSSDSIAMAATWMDWRAPQGLQSPSPVTFLGGIQDLPAGSHGYFTVELDKGNYALLGEAPDPQALGLSLSFSVR